MTATTRVRAELSAEALRANVRVIREATEGRRIFAMVKANAYGHGFLEAARALEDAGVEGLGVATVEEGLALRRAGVHRPAILTFAADYAGAHADVIRARLTPVVHRLDELEAFDALGEVVRVHLEVDTGMGRLGVRHDAFDEWLVRLGRHERIWVDGLFTHFAASEDEAEDEFTELQLDRFLDVARAVRDAGHEPMLHAANSGAIFRHPASWLDAVRPGISIYGVTPAPGLSAPLTPALRLVARVHALRELPAGDSVGYGRTFRATRPTRVATVLAGYGDGLLRAGSGRAEALLRGARVPLIGLISMDSHALDVTDVPGVEVGDEVVLMGRQGAAELTAHDWARWCGTNAYEVLTNLSARVPRVWIPPAAER